MTIALVLVSLIAVLVLIDDLKIRRKRYHELVERATKTLVGINVVGGVELPLPDDPRWAVEHVQFENGKEMALCIGGKTGVVVAMEVPRVYAGLGYPLPNSKAYAQAVIKAFRQRIVKDAIK